MIFLGIMHELVKDSCRLVAIGMIYATTKINYIGDSMSCF